MDEKIIPTHTIGETVTIQTPLGELVKVYITGYNRHRVNTLQGTLLDDCDFMKSSRGSTILFREHMIVEDIRLNEDGMEK